MYSIWSEPTSCNGWISAGYPPRSTSTFSVVTPMLQCMLTLVTPLNNVHISYRTRDNKFIKHKPLRPDELPNPGTLVAIDAEFVSMQQEETEFRSDGTKKVLRPARLSLARVSVLRGEGPSEGVPFIDDHIHTSEVIVDYLTEFSGIRCRPHSRSFDYDELTPL